MYRQWLFFGMQSPVNCRPLLLHQRCSANLTKNVAESSLPQLTILHDIYDFSNVAAINYLRLESGRRMCI